VGAEGGRGRGAGQLEPLLIGTEICRAARPEPPRAYTSREQCARGPRRERPPPSAQPAPPARRARWRNETWHRLQRVGWSGSAPTLKNRLDSSPRAAEGNAAYSAQR